MQIVFAIQLIIVLLILLPDASLSTQCVWADWRESLNRATWSKCPKNNKYLRGFTRGPGVQVGSIKYGLCCPASDTSNVNQPATCLNANWSDILDG